MSVDQNAIASALATAQRFRYYKPATVGEAVGVPISLWKTAGQPPAATAAPGLAGAVPDRTTLGAIPFTNPVNSLLMLRAAFNCAIAGTLILADRMWHNSGMSGTQITTDTTFAATNDITRNTSDANELWMEVTTAFGATGATLNVQYTNLAGTTGQHATLAHVVPGGSGAPQAQMIYPMQLQASDTGVKRPTGYHWSISTGTVGDFSVVVLRRLIEIPLDGTSEGRILDWAMCGLEKVPNDACVFGILLPSVAAGGLVLGRLDLGDLTP